MKLSENLIVSRHVHDKRALSEWFIDPSNREVVLYIGGCTERAERKIVDAIEIAQELLAEATWELLQIRNSSRVPAAFTQWFGPYSESRSQTVQNNLRRIKTNLYLPEVTILCGRCDPRTIHPVYFCKQTLQLWARRSVADRSLDQISKRNKSFSADLSGTFREKAKLVYISPMPAASFPSFGIRLV